MDLYSNSTYDSAHDKSKFSASRSVLSLILLVNFRNIKFILPSLNHHDQDLDKTVRTEDNILNN